MPSVDDEGGAGGGMDDALGSGLLGGTFNGGTEGVRGGREGGGGAVGARLDIYEERGGGGGAGGDIVCPCVPFTADGETYLDSGASGCCTVGL